MRLVLEIDLREEKSFHWFGNSWDEMLQKKLSDLSDTELMIISSHLNALLEDVNREREV